MKSQDKKLPKGDNQEEKGTETIPLDKGLQTTQETMSESKDR